MYGMKFILYALPVVVTVLGWIVLATIVDSYLKDKDKDNK